MRVCMHLYNSNKAIERITYNFLIMFLKNWEHSNTRL